MLSSDVTFKVWGVDDSKVMFAEDLKVLHFFRVGRFNIMALVQVAATGTENRRPPSIGEHPPRRWDLVVTNGHMRDTVLGPSSIDGER